MMPDTAGPGTLAEKAEAVEVARRRFEDAEAAESIARSEKTSALNALNAAQKAFDAALEVFKKAAPRESDWSRQEIDTIALAE